MKLKSILDKKN